MSVSGYEPTDTIEKSKGLIAFLENRDKGNLEINFVIGKLQGIQKFSRNELINQALKDCEERLELALKLINSD